MRAGVSAFIQLTQLQLRRKERGRGTILSQDWGREMSSNFVEYRSKMYVDFQPVSSCCRDHQFSPVTLFQHIQPQCQPNAGREGEPTCLTMSPSELFIFSSGRLTFSTALDNAWHCAICNGRKLRDSVWGNFVRSQRPEATLTGVTCSTTAPSVLTDFHGSLQDCFLIGS